MEEFLEYITLYRICWIGGRLGFGKTAMACTIADWMLRKGLVDGVITNFPTVFPAALFGEDDGTLYNRLVIFDEAWAELDNRTAMSNNRSYGAYARKFGCYWLFPSVHPIDSRLRAVTLKPSHRNLLTGINVWRFTIADDEKQPTSGTFGHNPSDAYGKYATSYIPTGDCGIHERFLATFFQETGTHFDAGTSRQQATETTQISDLKAAMA